MDLKEQMERKNDCLNTVIAANKKIHFTFPLHDQVARYCLSESCGVMVLDCHWAVVEALAGQLAYPATPPHVGKRDGKAAYPGSESDSAREKNKRSHG